MYAFDLRNFITQGRNRAGQVGLFPKNFIAGDPAPAPSPTTGLKSPSQSQSHSQQQYPSPPSPQQDVRNPNDGFQRQSLLDSPPEMSKNLIGLENRYTLTAANAHEATPPDLSPHPKTWNSRAVEAWIEREGFHFALPFIKSEFSFFPTSSILISDIAHASRLQINPYLAQGF